MTLLDLAKGLPAVEELRIADVGTGSGIIAVCVAKHLPRCRVTAIDRSRAALEVASYYATKRKAFGQPIVKFEGVSFRIAE